MSQSTDFVKVDNQLIDNIKVDTEIIHQSESIITKKYTKMLLNLENVKTWADALNSEEDMINEPDFWHCCCQLRQSLDELMKLK